MPVSPAFRHFFQIGDVTIHSHVQSISDANVRAIGSSIDLQDSYRRLMVHAPHKVQSRTESVDLLIFNNGRWSEGHLAQRLFNLINRTTDIIAYELVGTNPTHTPECSCAICCCQKCELLWLHNLARITDVRINGNDATQFEASISFEYAGYWKPLNRLIWRPAGEYAVSLSKYDTPLHTEFNWRDELYEYPSCEDVFHGRCQAFYKRNHTLYRWMYTPGLWQYIHRHRRYGYPETGYTAWWENEGIHNVVSHPFRWSAPPLSLYAFRKFRTLDTVATINITYRDVNEIKETTTTVDFDAINTSLFNAGIKPKFYDRLIIGDLDGHAVIFNDADPIFYVADGVTWQGDWPAQIYPGPNEIRIDGGGSIVAQHHYFRRL